jgi:hypothetical protein
LAALLTRISVAPPLLPMSAKVLASAEVRQVAVAENGRLRQVCQLFLQRQRRLTGDVER